MIKIKRALISVSDKTNLEKIVKFLNELKVEIISTGGTAEFIRKLDIPVRTISDFTKSEEMLDGRVKTLHPKVHAALLALRDNKDHCKQVSNLNIELIDMVIVNLYPFEQTVADPKTTFENAIENIDIGGPTMLRSAAKNHKSVAVLCDPGKYEDIIEEMKNNNGSVTEETCLRLAASVFQHTNEYDKNIALYFKNKVNKNKENSDQKFPEHLNVELEKIQTLRYGENPHQQAAFYKDIGSVDQGITNAKQLHGKELSFNNILDLDAALNIVKEFDMPAVSIVKHNNPCGVAYSDTIANAFKDALECDPLSAFGSIIGVNKSIDEDAAKQISLAGFIECIIAPEFSKEALEILGKKKNLRIMKIDNIRKKSQDLDFKRIAGGMLVECKDTSNIYDEDIKVVTAMKPTDEQLKSLLFAQVVAKHVKSNAIVLADRTKTIGIGAGQMSRVDSVIIAIRKANNTQGAVLASDAFFPKADSIEFAAKAGISCIIQPGGSIRDQEVIAAANKANIAMVMTGKRHFKH